MKLVKTGIVGFSVSYRMVTMRDSWPHLLHALFRQVIADSVEDERYSEGKPNSIPG